mmetsp:Transcript_11016/g.25892  ORF Transcript_11016/g.25892 Transcript_11016/m.25892 type:complete len:279 (+) Transcript_11016:337-1173(+)
MQRRLLVRCRFGRSVQLQLPPSVFREQPKVLRRGQRLRKLQLFHLLECHLERELWHKERLCKHAPRKIWVRFVELGQRDHLPLRLPQPCNAQHAGKEGHGVNDHATEHSKLPVVKQLPCIRDEDYLRQGQGGIAEEQPGQWALEELQVAVAQHDAVQEALVVEPQVVKVLCIGTYACEHAEQRERPEADTSGVAEPPGALGREAWVDLLQEDPRGAAGNHDKDPAHRAVQEHHPRDVGIHVLGDLQQAVAVLSGRCCLAHLLHIPEQRCTFLCAFLSS